MTPPRSSGSHRRRERRSLSVLPLLVFVAACTVGDPDSVPRLTIGERDGVPVVESAWPMWSFGLLEAAPTVIWTLGGAGDDGLIGDVREAVLLASGTVAFLDIQTGELKLVQSDGSIRTAARRGAGPGELQRPGNLQALPGDSIQVYDRLQRRVSVFSSTGDLGYSVPMEAPGRVPPTRLWRYQDTLFVGMRPVSRERRILTTTAAGSLGMIPMDVMLLDSNGGELGLLLSLPGMQDIETGAGSLAPAFGLESPFAFSPSGDLHYGEGGVPEFLTVSETGDTLRMTRLNLPLHPVDRDTLARMLAGDGGLATRMGRAVLDLPILAPEFLPDVWPAYKEIRGLPDGRVLLGSGDPFSLPSSGWYVTSRTCGWEGTLTLPPRTRLLDLDTSRGLILVSTMDELDVQTLELRALDLPGGRGGPPECL